jgi:hypothetical protein
MRRKRKRKARRLRKQPRRLTPPLLLRNDAGERELVEVDQDFITREIMRSTRTTALLTLAPNLRVEVGSRCINKRRVAVLKISPKDWQPDAPKVGASFRETLAAVKPRANERCRSCGANPCAAWCNREEYA